MHGHEYNDQKLGVFKVPIFVTSIFEQPERETGETRVTDRGTELKYSREENPTVRALEHSLAKLESAEDSLAFNSGMAAISTLYFSFLENGSKIIIPLESYSVTIQLAEELSKFGVKTEKVWPSTDKIIEAIDSNTKIVLLETITNPMLRVVDIDEISKACQERNIPLVIDNTFATPIIFKPLKHGAKVVVHSTTKYIAGHNDIVGGAIVTDKKTISENLWDWRRKLGNIMQPLEAFLALRGISTLSVRFEKISRNALEVAEFLKEHPRVLEVRYPGLKDDEYHSIANKLFEKDLYGGVVTFRVKDGREAIKVLRKVNIIKPAPSLGGVESLLTYPVISAAKLIAPEDRKRLGITEDVLRLSIGLEDVEDLKEDLDQALQ
ncbi:MAG: cystathionine gamma-synthase family protein [Candidatus Brockarchaeota archaeon]|nr:cystathionine gamma-synthase family protein [Candidatus Brockarchaeota archaeon]